MCSYCGCESVEVVGRFMAEHLEGGCAERESLDEMLTRVHPDAPSSFPTA